MIAVQRDPQELMASHTGRHRREGQLKSRHASGPRLFALLLLRAADSSYGTHWFCDGRLTRVWM